MVCGDSKSKIAKRSFYFYTKKGSLNFECKRCGYSGSFYRFMKEQMTYDFEEYKKDFYREKLEAYKGGSRDKAPEYDTNHQPEQKIPRTSLSKFLETCIPISDLGDDHKAVKFLTNRGFSNNELGRLFFSSNFLLTAKSINIDLGDDAELPEDERIIIPFFNKDKLNIQLIQGRSLSNTGLRYITIKSDPNVDKVFGLDQVDTNKTVYCVEGPFDSLFIDNCLAACDANLSRTDADVLIWDNEPRNENIIKYMTKAIEGGRHLVIWDTSPDKKVDINDMVLQGKTRDEIMNLIKSRTFHGIRAKLELAKWKKL